MAVSNPGRDIPSNYTLGLFPRARCKKATGGPLPIFPTRPPVNQPKDIELLASRVVDWQDLNLTCVIVVLLVRPDCAPRLRP